MQVKPFPPAELPSCPARRCRRFWLPWQRPPGPADIARAILTCVELPLLIGELWSDGVVWAAPRRSIAA